MTQKEKAEETKKVAGEATPAVTPEVAAPEMTEAERQAGIAAAKKEMDNVYAAYELEWELVETAREAHNAALEAAGVLGETSKEAYRQSQEVYKTYIAKKRIFTKLGGKLPEVAP